MDIKVFRVVIFSVILIFTGSLINAQVKFAEFRQISHEFDNTSEITTCDIDNDGDQDVIFADFRNVGVFWYENLDQARDFTTQRKIPSQHAFAQIEVIDLDNDGDCDIVGISRAEVIVLFKNLGEGRFATERILTTDVKNAALFIQAVDIDNDSDIDLVYYPTSKGEIAYLENKGKYSSFFQYPRTLLKPSVALGGLYISDIDLDGDQDIIGEHGTLTAYVNNGDYNFQETEITNTRHYTKSIFVKDFDNDGDDDIVGYVENGNFYYVQNNNGSFSHSIISSDIKPEYMTTGDIDADGDVDILFTGGASEQNSYIIKMNSSQEFSDPIEIDHNNKGWYYSNLALGDLTGDGREEPIFIYTNFFNGDNNFLYYFENNSSSNLLEANKKLISAAFNKNLYSAYYTDIDNDGDIDVITANSGNNAAIIYYENIDLIDNFGPPREIYLNSNVDINRLTWTDINNDGNMDIIFMEEIINRNNEYYLILNEGNEKFSSQKILSFQYNSDNGVLFTTVDVDNDQYDDLIFYNKDEQEINIYRNNQNNNYIPYHDISSVKHVKSFIIKDYDSNGFNDIIINQTNTLYVYKNENIGKQWADPIELTYDRYSVIHDIDNDGHLDFIRYSNDQFRIYITYNVNNVDSSETVILNKPTTLDFLRVVDIDNDGDMDILTSPHHYLENEENTRKYKIKELFPFVTDFGRFSFNDVDNDGDLDITVILDGNRIGWYPNLSKEPSSIKGQVYFDENKNQIKDENERGIPNIGLTLQPFKSSTLTSKNGNYVFPAKLIKQTINAIIPPNWNPTTDAQVTLDKTNNRDTSFVNFGLFPSETIRKANIDISFNATRCGFDVPFYITVRNEGTLPINGYFKIRIDTLTTIVNSSPQPDSIIENELYYSYKKLYPGENEQVNLTLLMPDEKYNDSTLFFDGMAYILDTLGNILNNDGTEVVAKISCAIDPNDKLVTPSIENFINYTLIDDTLIYTIRFQNTGSDTAINIKIDDYIHSLLDEESIQVVSSSHEYTAVLLKDRLLSFYFDNIYLPDSTTNLLESMGYIKFKIKPLNGIKDNSYITNKAEIYFDFNDPIITNTVSNKMVSEYPFEIIKKNPLCAIPESGFININFPIKSLKYEWNTGRVDNNLDSLLEGTYSVNVYNKKGTFVGDTTITLTQPQNYSIELSSTQEIDNMQNGTATVKTIGGNPPFTYEWNTTPVQNTPTATNLISGLYTVEVMDSTKCINTDSIRVYSNLEEYNPTIDISPNPSSKKISIKLDYYDNLNSTLYIFNNLGQLIHIYGEGNTKLEKEIIIDNLLPGFYRATLYNEKKTSTQSFIILN